LRYGAGEMSADEGAATPIHERWYAALRRDKQEMAGGGISVVRRGNAETYERRGALKRQPPHHTGVAGERQPR